MTAEQSMEERLLSMLRSLLMNVEIINEELGRFLRTELCIYTPSSRQMVEEARESYLRGLETLRALERQLGNG